MPIDSALGRLGIKQGLCTSSTRPANPFEGQVIYESDTNRTLVYDNAAWVVIADSQLLSIDTANSSVNISALKVNSENVTAYTGRRNLLFNGAMQVAQRGTSFTVGGSETYTVDRWKSVSGPQATVSQSTDAPSGFSNSINYSCNNAEGATVNESFVSQVLEGQDVQCIGYGTADCKQISVSFWVKSNVTGTFNVWFFRWNGTRHIARSYTIDSADTWEYKTVLVPADTSNAVDNDNNRGFEIRFYLAVPSTWTGSTESSVWSAVSDNNRAPGNGNMNSSTSNYWRVTGVQLELGDKATPFEHRSYGEELALCQRYYQRNLANGDDAIASGVMYTTTLGIFSYTFPKMRVAPTITFVSGGDVVTGGAVTAVASSAIVASETQTSTTQIGVTTSALTAGHGAVLRLDNNYFELSAEL